MTSSHFGHSNAVIRPFRTLTFHICRYSWSYHIRWCSVVFRNSSKAVSDIIWTAHSTPTTPGAPPRHGVGGRAGGSVDLLPLRLVLLLVHLLEHLVLRRPLRLVLLVRSCVYLGHEPHVREVVEGVRDVVADAGAPETPGSVPVRYRSPARPSSRWGRRPGGEWTQTVPLEAVASTSETGEVVEEKVFDRVVLGLPVPHLVDTVRVPQCQSAPRVVGRVSAPWVVGGYRPPFSRVRRPWSGRWRRRGVRGLWESECG